MQCLEIVDHQIERPEATVGVGVGVEPETDPERWPLVTSGQISFHARQCGTRSCRVPSVRVGGTNGPRNEGKRRAGQLFRMYSLSG